MKLEISLFERNKYIGDGKVERLKNFSELDVYHRPELCPECGGVMIFKGCGEYKCEKCRHIEYDDYGKVRNYVEKHAGVTAAQASDATGVKQKTIRTMLKESRLEIAEGSSTFLKCEICGVKIRSGRVCPKGEVEFNRRMEQKLHERQKKMAGFGMGRDGEEGTKRFIRDK